MTTVDTVGLCTSDAFGAIDGGFGVKASINGGAGGNSSGGIAGDWGGWNAVGDGRLGGLGSDGGLGGSSGGGGKGDGGADGAIGGADGRLQLIWRPSCWPCSR